MMKAKIQYFKAAVLVIRFLKIVRKNEYTESITKIKE